MSKLKTSLTETALAPTQHVMRICFLLGVEKGAILGCNGWDKQFSKPLGDPIGPAVQKGNSVERHFKSGTYVTWDISKKVGNIFWANSTGT